MHQLAYRVASMSISVNVVYVLVEALLAKYQNQENTFGDDGFF
jgi:hypothetical protein